MSKYCTTLIFLICLSLLSTGESAGTIIYVPDDSTTIQGAINGAADTDTIVVRPGIYIENIDFLGKAIFLTSESGPDSTTIDGNAAGPVVAFQSGENSTAVLNGFTITNGNALSFGGGIYCFSSSPTILNNVITENVAGSGGGISNDSTSSPIVINCLFTGNFATFDGGGMYIDYFCDPTVINCTFSGNTAGRMGGGIYNGNSNLPVLTNCILWNDIPDEISDSSSTLSVHYSDIQGGFAGTGNIDTDPLFFDPDSSDYHLQQDPPQPGIINPCVDAGDSASQMIIGTTRTDGVQDSGVIDMGYHYPLAVAENIPPVAVFDWTPDITDPGDTVLFDASGSYDPDGEIVLYEWDWESDGIYDVSDTLSTTTHVWTLQGNHDVTLRVTDTDSATGTETRMIHISTTIYVPDDYPTIQAAIDASFDGDVIVVRSGTYVENIDFLGKAVVLMSEEGPNVTTIDGNQAGSVVLFISGEGENTVLDGFTITNGTGTLYDEKYYGGGIFCLDSSPTIINNKILDNYVIGRGAGIGCRNSTPTISNNEIRNNDGGMFLRGGGIYCENSSHATITNNTIRSNSANYGGGIACRNNSSPLISGNTISANYAGSGGGVYCENSSPTITDNFISGNQGEVEGGGIFSNYTSTSTSPQITNNQFINNRSILGGGIRIFGGGSSLPFVANNFITNNNAEEGGGIYYSYNFVTVVGNVISRNTASGATGNGGGIYCFRAPADIINNTISDNSASNSGGSIYLNSASPTITNTISWGNSAITGPEIYASGGSSPNITYCDIQGGWTGEGNIDINPLFADPEYQLQSYSPCIDSGVPAILDACLPPGLGSEWSDMGAYGGAENCGWPEESISLFIEPLGPTNLTGGDTLHFSTQIVNNTGDSLTGNYWLSVNLPSQNEILIPETLLNYSNPLTGTVPPVDTLNLTNWLFIPAQVDTGSYKVIGRIGNYPNAAIDERWLDIQVLLGVTREDRAPITSR